MGVSKIKKAVIREDLLSITANYKEAIILNQFIYWSERVEDADKFIKAENEIAKRNGEPEKEPLYGWIYKAAEELADEVMLGLSASQVRKYIAKLVEYGYIQRRNNPKYRWDRTFQYKVNLVNIAKALKAKGYPLNDYKITIPDEDAELNARPCAFNENEMSNQTSAGDGAIPEITTETINNKDYNTENTKMYTSPSKEDEGINVYLSFEEKHIEKPYCPNTGYTDEQLRDYIKAKIPMLVKQRGGLNVGTQEDLIDIILYFYQEYNRWNPAQHPVLSNATFSDIIQKYECPPETMCEYGAYGFADYKEVIDKYFETDFGRQKKSEYGNAKPITRLLPHFMCDNIREYLYRRVTGL